MRRRIVACGALVASLCGGLALPAGGMAQSSNLQLTVAARVCPSYTDISANRARNNIQESLKDLGVDTAYPNGDPISPAKEDAFQKNCSPLPDWTFTLGKSYKSRAVSGPWGSLSIVTSAFTQAPIVTQPSVPLLDVTGQPTGDQIRGAVTITLTKEQADLAAKTSQLWIQGGTPTDPILNGTYPGQYGFGALRCAIDNLNGDNVEWISFPNGVKHVFCYAYYVQPPPTSGTIIVRKQISAPAGTAATAFPFKGNISFNADQSFAVTAGLNAPGSMTFYRAGGSAWNFREIVPVGWSLATPTCTSQKGSTFAIASPEVTVSLVDGDTVTCTFTDTLTPPPKPADLVLSKVTAGGVGTFGYVVRGPSTAPANHPTSITTTQPGTQVSAPAFQNLAIGTYTITESEPQRNDGYWTTTQVRCDAKPRGLRRALRGAAVTVDLVADTATFCTFFNRFIPNGSIRLRKVTLGATGSVGFVITDASTALPNVQYLQNATTTAEGEAVIATGDDTSNIPLGAYDIRETTPSGGDGGTWQLDSVICNGEPVPTAQGRLRVTLTADEPNADCTVTNRFVPNPEPTPTPPTPTPTPTPPPPPGSGTAGIEIVSPKTNLVVTKSATPTRIRSGQAIHYRVTITNRSKVLARSVTVAEVEPPSHLRVHVSTTKGTCNSARPLVCSLGNLKPGQRVVLTGVVRTRLVGRVVNRVAVNTATDERSLRDNRAQVAVYVQPQPRFTG